LLLRLLLLLPTLLLRVRPLLPLVALLVSLFLTPPLLPRRELPSAPVHRGLNRRHDRMTVLPRHQPPAQRSSNAVRAVQPEGEQRQVVHAVPRDLPAV
jgi:hypothetical protein